MRWSAGLALCLLPLATTQELSPRQWVRHSGVHNALQGQHLRVGLFAGTFAPYMATNPSAAPMQALSPGQGAGRLFPQLLTRVGLTADSEGCADCVLQTWWGTSRPSWTP